MRKALMGILLTSCSVSAGAFVPFEIQGQVATYFIDQTTNQVTYLGTSHFRAYGDLAVGPATFHADPSEIGYSILYGHYTSWDFNFTFDNAPLANFDDGAFHSGKGWGLIRNGYVQYYDHVLTIDRAKVSYDWEFPADIFPTLEFIAAPVSTPEPASWAMMIGGFALAGATLRRGTYRMTFA